ncbi:hypothetical protein BgiBS90_004777 [Biomphalaria glabrata]|nr:hypothetical protein BgiBS90_004777 [Biomphalaria glabrata]
MKRLQVSAMVYRMHLEISASSTSPPLPKHISQFQIFRSDPTLLPHRPFSAKRLMWSLGACVGERQACKTDWRLGLDKKQLALLFHFIWKLQLQSTVWHK